MLLAVIALFGAIRWRLADTPLERDEGEYAYSGQLMLQGIPPYQLAYNMKLPGTYAAYAAILTVFGQTGRGVHLGFLLVNATCVILVYVIAARLFGALAGAIAGASYAFLSTHQSVLGFAAHATHFVVLAALVGLILMLRAEETKRGMFFFWSGLAFGFAFLMKQPGIFFGGFGFCYLAVQCRPRSRSEWRPWGKGLGLFLLGATLPFALTCLVLYRAGVFHNFWFWIFSYASQYASTETLSPGLRNLSRSFSVLLRASPWLWIIALAGVSAPWWNSSARRHAVFMLGLLLFSFVAVCPGLYFRGHYFVLMLPAVAILIAVAVSSAVAWIGEKFPSRRLQLLPVFVFVAVWGLAIWNNREVYFELTPEQVCRRIYSSNPFVEAEQAGDYLREHSAPSDTVMVFGSEPEIYFDARRHSASGYIYMYSLLEEQSYWPVMQKQMMAEVEARRPAYVVFVNAHFSWLGRPNSPQMDELRTWVSQYIAGGFDQVAAYGGDEAKASQSAETGRRHPTRPEIFILKRKS